VPRSREHPLNRDRRIHCAGSAVRAGPASRSRFDGINRPRRPLGHQSLERFCRTLVQPRIGAANAVPLQP
jgi:hypothetical protein